MPFGELFTGTFVQLWRHKRLWLFGLLGLALTSLGSLVYQVFQYRWQTAWFTQMRDLMRRPGDMPEWYFGAMMSTMAWLWVGMGIWLIVGLVGYIVNLVMRGATMHEAAVAWGGGRTETGRGLTAGAGRAVEVFLIDLLWLLPGLLLGCGGLGAIAAVIAAFAAVDEGGEAAGAVVLTLIGALCCVFCLALLVALVAAVFAPLMYQSAVVGRRSLGAAISEGWRLAKAHLGAMIIFAILLWVLSIALALLVSLLTLPFTLPWMSGWMQDWGKMMESTDRGISLQLPQFGNMGWLFVATLVSGFLTWLTSSFLQSFRLTLYAGVYQHLAGRPDPVGPAPLAPVGGAPAPALPIAVPAEVNESGSAPSAASAEIMVPDETAKPGEAPVQVPLPPA